MRFIQAGDKVTFPGCVEAEVLAIVLLRRLTRIEPAVPQPKFPIGTKVRKDCPSGFPGAVVAINYSYDVEWVKGSPACGVPEDELEAVPEVCPTCGGKVGDG